jgi:hypothetical protein
MLDEGNHIHNFMSSSRAGGVSIRKERSRARSRRGGVSENRIAGSAAARLFFLTAVAIAIATRPFKFHEISVSNTSSSFVSSIHSLGRDVGKNSVRHQYFYWHSTASVWHRHSGIRGQSGTASHGLVRYCPNASYA